MSIEEANKLIDRALFLMMTSVPINEQGCITFTSQEQGILQSVLLTAKEELVSVARKEGKWQT